MTKPKRDNAYYLERLRKARPDLHKAVIDGVMSAAEALERGGIKRRATPLTRLKSAWKAASDEEREAFRDLICPGPGTATASGPTAAGPAPGRPAPSALPASSSPSPRPLHRGGYLEPWARKRILEIMERRGMASAATLKTGDLMRELGFENRRDQSIPSAIRHGTRISNDELLRALERWLADNASV